MTLLLDNEAQPGSYPALQFNPHITIKKPVGEFTALLPCHLTPDTATLPTFLHHLYLPNYMFIVDDCTPPCVYTAHSLVYRY